ncbi:MAG: hypothetical protein GF313_15835, partial [Caldithrix sp.]|nr:hypothetical protein [Caldithrix sp.]
MNNKVFMGWALIIISFIVTNLAAQENIKRNLFNDYENLIDEIRKNNAQILSPENFEKAIENYKEANALYDERKGDIVKIRERLEEARKYAERASEVVQVANVTFKGTLEARDAALNAEAPRYAEQLWQDAEDKLHDAARNLEDDDMED